jgi:hypothetical protein
MRETKELPDTTITAIVDEIIFKDAEQSARALAGLVKHLEQLSSDERANAGYVILRECFTHTSEHSEAFDRFKDADDSPPIECHTTA